MKRVLVAALLCCLAVALGSRLWAEDLTGRWGVGGIAQASTAIGVDDVRSGARDVASDFGAMVRYGLSKHWGVGLSYEDIDLGNRYRIEPITLQGIYSFLPNQTWTPIALLGAGAASTDPSEADHFTNMSAKAGLGLEYFPCHYASLAGLVNYHYVSETGDAYKQVHALTAGVLASLYFGGPNAAAAPKAIAQVPVPPAPVMISVNPTQTVLTDGQSQALAASVAGTTNQAVTWSLSPALGSISAQGVYTAPATVALKQTVVATATSVANPSKSASATILLQPAKAAEKVSISLNVLFDTAKAIVKPDYDAEIKKVADFMTTYTGTKAEIEGHTDNVGNAAYNETLSQQRADAVRQYLVDHFRIDASRLTAKGYGQNRPIADNGTKEGRARNRRVIATLESATK